MTDFFQTSEAWVQGVISKVQTAVEVVETDLAAAISWLNSHIAAVAAEVSQVVGGIESTVSQLQAAGIKLPPATQAAIDDANAAVAGLNAIAAAAANQEGTAQELIDGYVAAKNSLALTASAAATLATAPVANPVITPSV